MAYMLPQVIVNQLFSEVPLNVIQNQNVLVFGPNYQMFRYSDEETRPDLYIGHYDGRNVYTAWPSRDPDFTVEPEIIKGLDSNGNEVIISKSPMEFEYPKHPLGTDVDTSSVKLIGENVTILLTSLKAHDEETPVGQDWDGLNGFEKLDDDVSGADFDGRIKLKVNVAGKKEMRHPKFKREIEVGDRIRIPTVFNDDGVAVDWFYSTIMEVFESSKGSGNYDCVRIADTIPDYIEFTEERDSNGVVHKMYDHDIDFVTDLDGWEIPREGQPKKGNYQWSALDDVFRINGDVESGENMVIRYPAWDGDDAYYAYPRHQIISADLYIEYRALLMGATDTLHTITNNDDVYTVLGEVVPENPLAFGVHKVLQNSADRVVYYMATRGNNVEDYGRVLEAATKTDKVYILVPLTQDPEVIDDVKAHVDAMSTGTNKLWRIAFVNHVVPEWNIMYTKAASTDGKGTWAKIEQYRNSGEKCIVTFVETEYTEGETTADTHIYRASSQTKCMSQVVPLDLLVVYADKSALHDKYTDEIVPKEYVIDRVISNNVLRIVCNEDDEVISELLNSDTVRCEVKHVYTYQEQTKAIASVSRHYMDRRIYNVFPTWYRNEAGDTINGVFLAAAVGGLVSSVLPQQPITNVELTGIASVPICYETFSRQQLNEIAEGGTFIVMQDLPGDRVYVRHQISTEYGSNNLLKSELSITKNLDSISYYFAEVYRPYIGRYNITPKLLLVLRNIAENALAKLERDTEVGLIGPQVLPEGTEIVALYQDPVNQDHVWMEIKLNLPKPFNVLDLNLEVI